MLIHSLLDVLSTLNGGIAANGKNIVFINYRIFTDGSKEGNRVADALVHRDNTKCVRLPDTARISSSSSS